MRNKIVARTEVTIREQGNPIGTRFWSAQEPVDVLKIHFETVLQTLHIVCLTFDSFVFGLFGFIICWLNDTDELDQIVLIFFESNFAKSTDPAHSLLSITDFDKLGARLIRFSCDIQQLTAAILKAKGWSMWHGIFSTPTLVHFDYCPYLRVIKAAYVSWSTSTMAYS